MEVIIGKKINLIKFHDFLDRIEVQQVYSSLHALYNMLTAGLEPGEGFEYHDKYYTKESLIAVMKEEEGVVESITLKEQPAKYYEMILKFTSGNEIVVKVKEQLQYLQIQKYIMEV